MHTTSNMNRQARSDAASNLNRDAARVEKALGHKPGASAIRAIVDELARIKALPAGARTGDGFPLVDLIDKGNGAGSAAVYGAAIELSNGNLADMALRWLDTVHAPSDFVELACLPPLGGGMQVAFGTLGDAADRDRLRQWLAERIGWQNLYYGLQPRKAVGLKHANADNVVAHVCVPLDIDFKGAPGEERDAWIAANSDRLMTIMPASNDIISTGRGLQCVVRVERSDDPTEMTRRRKALRELMTRAGGAFGDGFDNITGLPGIARLPYTINVLTREKRAAGAAIALALPVRECGAGALPVSFDTAVSSIAAAFGVTDSWGNSAVGTSGGVAGSGGRDEALGDTAAAAAVAPPPASLCRFDTAPSKDVFRAFAAALPNDLSYDDWISVGHAMYGATEGEGLDEWVEFSAKWPDAVPGAAEDKWPTFQDTHKGWGPFRERVLRSVDKDTARQLAQMEARNTFPAILPGSAEAAAVEAAAASAIAAAPPWVAKMNQEYALVVGVNGVVRLDAASSSAALFEILGYTEFRTFHNGRLKILNGDRGRPLGAGSAWLDHSLARRYRGLGLWPVGEAPEGMLNLYDGLPERSSRECATGGSAGCQLVLEFIRDVLADEDTKVNEYLLNWLAWIVQNPLKKPGVNVVLIGAQGTGKGTLGKMLLDIFGPRYSLHVQQERHLVGDFSGHLEGKLFLFIDEAMFGKNPSTNGVYKARTTEEKMLVEHKGQTPRMAPNRFAILIASNELAAAPVEPGDRRATVLPVPSTRKGDTAYWAALWREWDTGGREAFIDFLRKRYLAGFDQTKPLATAAKMSAAEATGDIATRFWLDRLETGELPSAGAGFGPPVDWSNAPVFVSRAALISAFHAYAQRERARHLPTEREVIRAIETLCPSAREIRPTVKGPKPHGLSSRPRGLSFPDLDTCRKEANKALGGA